MPRVQAPLSLLVLGVLVTTSACDTSDRPPPGQALSAGDAAAICASITEFQVACHNAAEADAKATCESRMPFARGDYMLELDACLAEIEGIDEGSAGTCGVDHLTCLQDASDSITPTATAWRYFEAHAASLDRCPDQAAAAAYKLYTDQFLEDLIACFDEPTCDAVESCRNVVWAPLD